MGPARNFLTCLVTCAHTACRSHCLSPTLPAAYTVYRDGPQTDPLGGNMGLHSEDFRHITRLIVGAANMKGGACKGRVVSVLEGGYDVSPSNGLARCALAHCSALQEAPVPELCMRAE